MPSEPVMITQRVSMPASRSSIAVAIPSRISWSSALHLPGLRIVRRATASAGRSSRSLPDASSFIEYRVPIFCKQKDRVWSRDGAPLFEDYECVALGDRLALLHRDLLHCAGVFGLNGHFHLHRLEDHDRVPLVNGVADRDLDLPNGSGDVGLDLRQAVPPVRGRRRPLG